jgi:hypothetical protein
MSSQVIQVSSRPNLVGGGESFPHTGYEPSTPHREGRRSNERSASRGSASYFFLAAIFFLLGPALAKASTYYLSPSGNDSNSGASTSASWLTPNHNLNCGDVVIASASTSYSATNFYTGKWGTVNCPAGNNVAWLKCATFDACKIYTTNNQGMWIDRSFWGVQGWEVSTSASDVYGTCFNVAPKYSAPAEIHHVILANDIANGCSQGGFVVTNRGSIGVDYVAIIGSIAYNAAQGTNTCTSGISIYPVASDYASGTHIYVGGSFSYGNLEPNGCGGRTPTDGEGIIFDALDGTQTGLPPYTQQTVAYNNIVVNNGARGIQNGYNSLGSYHAGVWLYQNTVWGNLTDPHQSWLGCGEIAVTRASNTLLYSNLVSTRSATGCGGNPIYAIAVSAGDSSDTVVNNLAYGPNGNNTFLYASGSFGWGSGNQFGTNPNFTNPVNPGAPSCGGTANVPGCMATVIANFKPKTASATYLGYQKPSSTPNSDSLFPRWLCSASLPSGLVTMGCN